MDLPPFLLDQWLSKYDFATPPIRYNLASSTGPRWTVDQIATLGGDAIDLGAVELSYSPAQGSRALREAIAGFHGVDPDWVVVTTGASEALSILFCLFEKPGGNVLIPDPGYPAYAAMTKAWHINARAYALNREKLFAQEAEPILNATDMHTVSAIVNTPHNPSGSVMDPATLGRLAGALGERGVPLIVDEVYHPLYFGAPLASAAGIENVIVISDMSKALSLPGLRMGWIIDRDAERRKRIIDARSYFTISGSPALERLTVQALNNRHIILDRLHNIASANLATLETFINNSNGRIRWSRPRGGTTAFPWFSDGSDSRAFCTAAAEAGVLLAPGDCFGHPAHMRIGFAQQAEGFDVAISRCAEILAA